MRHIQGIVATTGLLLTAFLGSARATSLGFKLTLSEGPNTPKIKVENTSDAGFEIGEFALTIGNTAYNFDSVTASSETKSNVGGATLVAPDRHYSGGVRSDEVRYRFSGFSAGGWFTFAAELDLDDLNTPEDYRAIFFNNADAPNAVASAGFPGDRWVSLTLWDGPVGLPSYEFSVAQPVPLPGSAVLLGCGLLGLAARRRRR